MLRAKLTGYFAALIAVFTLLSVWFGIRVINERTVAEAQEHVRADLRAAWSVYNGRLKELEIILGLEAGKRDIVSACRDGRWDDAQLVADLRALYERYGFDFLTMVSPDGNATLRAAPPHRPGDSLAYLAPVTRALAGKPAGGAMLLSGTQVENEAEGLAARAFLEVEATQKARRSPKTEESRALVVCTAVPVRDGAQVVGTLLGGVVLNRNAELVDRIADTVYDNARGATATVFLDDCRVATTVRMKNGNRAIGTRVSKEVADQVLDNGKPWVGRAFVVDEWYLTAYDPIRDVDGKVVGMLYVGILEEPFRELSKTMIWRFISIALVVAAAAFVAAFIIAGRLARPIRLLARAAETLKSGTYPEAIPVRDPASESGVLTAAFNDMTRSLQERERELQQTNESLQAVNRNYMELLGFVTHELKSPLAAMKNYIYLMKKELIGPLTEKQAKAVSVFDANIARMNEMVRHYLNLSRIEKGEMKPARTRVQVVQDVLDPLLLSHEPEFERRRVRVANSIPDDLALSADLNMTREVFENLVGNAVKYGREGGEIALTCEREGDMVLFRVRNEGEGIPPERLPALFKKFSRIEDLHASGKQKGTGLGLFITRTIVEAHGGRIEADSEAGAWAEFTFTMPYGGDAQAHTGNAV